ncbi:hypothetical protein PG999_013328 [Apiospora kogelbergensis]|uniref:Uncharacterized protein n=1 Tax=Apiospora kogelbergensis TaxID=1337665 RepID=A0AAW0Q5Q0_9PEZI
MARQGEEARQARGWHEARYYFATRQKVEARFVMVHDLDSPSLSIGSNTGQTVQKLGSHEPKAKTAKQQKVSR